ncbi:anaphase-promoting complex subunit cdc27 [Cryptotrichosporon argae]
MGSSSPSPSPAHLTARLRSLILASPGSTALFYARLLHALLPTHESTHLLALAFLGARQAYAALHLARDAAEPGAVEPAGCYGCALIVARACDALGRFTEGHEVLGRASERARRFGGTGALPVLSTVETPATASLLLATLAHKSKAPGSSAPELYLAALADDPYLWEAFTGLCDTGHAAQPDVLFADPPRARSRHATLSPSLAPARPAPDTALFARRQLSPLAAPSSGLFTPDAATSGAVGMLGNPGAWDTSSVMGDTTFPSIEPVAASRRPLPNLIASLLPSSTHAALRASSNSTTSAQAAMPVMKRPRAAARRPEPAAAADAPGGAGMPLARDTRTNGSRAGSDLRDLRERESNGDKDVRRSTRLSAAPVPKIASRIQAKDKRTTRSRSTTSSASGATETTTSPASLDAAAQAAADDYLRDIVRRCARAYAALAAYRCKDALAELDGLPAEVQAAPWALGMAARSFYEMANYVFARRAFQALLEAEPYHFDGLELYSTTLWHLGDAVALSHLAQLLLGISRELPQAWVAAGNLLSLARAHDDATRCLRRAAQLDPGAPYAATLAGHEAVELEEYERAAQCFRTALRNDARHYNAWYGLGLVYLRTGKARHAEHHFRRAAEINPANAVLWCCIGDVLEQEEDYTGALDVYERAVACAPDGVMAKFKRARALVALGDIERAIAALGPLSREAPDEAQVFFLLGKCLLRAGRNTEAAVALTTARELQPKLERAIRAVMVSGGADEDEDAGM